MAVIFLILKIIGIVLVAILGLVLFTLLIVLIVPFKYKIYGSKEDNFEIDAKFTWLFSIFSVQYILKDNEDDLKIRIPFFNSKENKTEKKKDETFSSSVRKENAAAEVHILENKNEDVPQENSDNNISKNVSENITKDKKIFSAFLKKLKTVINRLKEIIKEIIKYKNIAYEFDMEFGIKRVAAITFKLVKNMLIAFKPGKFEINAVFGLDDPADTGVLLGVISMATAYLPGDYYIDADFENTVLKGNLIFKGRTILLLILIPIIKFILTKPILDIIKKYRR